MMRKDRTKQKSKYIYFARNLGGKGLFRLIFSRLFSVNHYYVMQLNLKNLNQSPLRREPPGAMGKLTFEDLLTIKKNVKQFNSEDRREILARVQFYERGFQNCYVMKVNDKIAHIQWLIYPSENETIHRSYKRIFYPLHHSQVMIENAFTFPEFRGYGYITFFSRKLLKMAKDEGYKSAIGYIKSDKIVSLNEFHNMGFKITKLLREQKFLGYTYRTL